MNTEFYIRGELITLDALLKATGLADSGGQAKELINEGETRRGRKLRGGEVVEFQDQKITVKAQQ